MAAYKRQLGWRQIELGRDCLGQRRSDQALDWFERAEKNFRRAHNLEPIEEFQAWIQEIRCARARTLAQLKRYEDAVAEAYPLVVPPRLLLGPKDCFPDYVPTFNVACAYSILSAVALQNDKLPDRARISEAHASQAIKLLADIDWKFSRLYLKSHLEVDKDLDPLRARQDFIALMKRVKKDWAKQAGK
jgi:hypothetical protein